MFLVIAIARLAITAILNSISPTHTRFILRRRSISSTLSRNALLAKTDIPSKRISQLVSCRFQDVSSVPMSNWIALGTSLVLYLSSHGIP